MSLMVETIGKTQAYDEAEPEDLPLLSLAFFCVETEKVIDRHVLP
jgi:hypothetical protein